MRGKRRAIHRRRAGQPFWPVRQDNPEEVFLIRFSYQRLGAWRSGLNHSLESGCARRSCWRQVVSLPPQVRRDGNTFDRHDAGHQACWVQVEGAGRPGKRAATSRPALFSVDQLSHSFFFRTIIAWGQQLPPVPRVILGTAPKLAFLLHSPLRLL